MTAGLTSLRRDVSFALILRWVMAAMLLRALLPLGMMPETRAVLDGGPLLAFCGAPTASLSDDDGDPGHRDHADCPFALPSLAAPPAPHWRWVAATRIVPSPLREIAAGPPLGARAPPALSALL